MRMIDSSSAITTRVCPIVCSPAQTTRSTSRFRVSGAGRRASDAGLRVGRRPYRDRKRHDRSRSPLRGIDELKRSLQVLADKGLNDLQSQASVASQTKISRQFVAVVVVLV